MWNRTDVNYESGENEAEHNQTGNVEATPHGHIV